LELEFVTSTLNWWRTESPNWMQLCITTFGVLDRNIFNSVRSNLTKSAQNHTIRTVVWECCKGDDASQRENGKFDPLPFATPKPLRRSSQNVAHVIKFWISTDMQNLVTIPQGVTFPHMRESGHQNV